jgi:hypothetical protein
MPLVQRDLHGYDARMATDQEQTPQSRPAFSDLLRNLPESSREEAAESLRRYAQLALRIYERTLLDPEAHAELKRLTAQKRGSTMSPAPVEGQDINNTQTR